MLILLLNEIPCRSLADYMRSAKFEFVLKKNKAKNRILNDFTLSSCKLRLTLTFKSQFEQFPYGEDNGFTFMLENNSAKRKAVSHISYCSFSRVSWQVEHRHVQHIRKWCGQQHEAFRGIFAFRVISRKMDNSFSRLAQKTGQKVNFRPFFVKFWLFSQSPATILTDIADALSRAVHFRCLLLARIIT